MFRKKWQELIYEAEVKQKELQGEQSDYLGKLKDDVKRFIVEVNNFHDRYSQEGPMVPNIKPKEAMSRLNNFQLQYEMIERKFNVNLSGENLFGLPNQQYPKLEQIQSELENLKKLYNLYG